MSLSGAVIEGRGGRSWGDSLAASLSGRCSNGGLGWEELGGFPYSVISRCSSREQGDSPAGLI